MKITSRISQPTDGEFLFSVYASTRAEEMALVPWTPEQKESFLRMQSNAQLTHYQKYYPKAEHQIIQCDENSIGRLIVDRSKDPILVIDIALLPEYRNNGIGTALITNLMAEAANLHWALTLHVEVFNPAMRLYERLGFVKTSEQGIYHEMMWQPQTG
jgi:ribosomal protein S18 acetylase RimI-like enzyme